MLDAKTLDGVKVYYDENYNIYTLDSDDNKLYLDDDTKVSVYDYYRRDYFNMSVLHLKGQLMLGDKFVKESREFRRGLYEKIKRDGK